MGGGLVLHQKLIDTYQSIQYPENNRPVSYYPISREKPNPISVNFYFLSFSNIQIQISLEPIKSRYPYPNPVNAQASNTD